MPGRIYSFDHASYMRQWENMLTGYASGYTQPPHSHLSYIEQAAKALRKDEKFQNIKIYLHSVIQYSYYT